MMLVRLAWTRLSVWWISPKPELAAALGKPTCICPYLQASMHARASQTHGQAVGARCRQHRIVMQRVQVLGLECAAVLGRVYHTVRLNERV